MKSPFDLKYSELDNKLQEFVKKQFTEMQTPYSKKRAELCAKIDKLLPENSHELFVELLDVDDSDSYEKSFIWSANQFIRGFNAGCLMTRKKEASSLFFNGILI